MGNGSEVAASRSSDVFDEPSLDGLARSVVARLRRRSDAHRRLWVPASAARRVAFYLEMLLQPDEEAARARLRSSLSEDLPASMQRGFGLHDCLVGFVEAERAIGRMLSGPDVTDDERQAGLRRARARLEFGERHCVETFARLAGDHEDDPDELSAALRTLRATNEAMLDALRRVQASAPPAPALGVATPPPPQLAPGTSDDAQAPPTLAAPRTPGEREPLTRREREVLSLVAEGLRNDEIGRRLGLASETVRTYVQRALLKLGAATRAHAVAIALRRRLI